jgi:hypothetical protein
MSLVLQSSGGGQITIQEPATASNFTQTLPAATGTVQVSGNMPAFSAYLANGSVNALSAGAFTKCSFDTENFDTNNNFASSRFTPTVAGYYQLNSGVATQGAPQEVICAFYKNGSSYAYGVDNVTGGNSMCSSIIYFNGSTDYVEVYAFSANARNQAVTANYSWFNGSMVRSS